MNRLQNSIVRFLKYVIESEELIILINIGSLSFVRVSFIADRSLILTFAMQEREYRPSTARNHWIVKKWAKFKIVIIIIIIYCQYTRGEQNVRALAL